MAILGEVADLGGVAVELEEELESREAERLDKLHLGECPVCGFLVINVEGLKGTQCTNCGFVGSCCA